MKPQYQQLYRDVAATHASVYDTVANARTATQKSADLQDLADLAYVLRECEKLLDDSRKEVKRLAEAITSKVCFVHTAQAQARGDLRGEPIRTPYCTCSPVVKMSANIPSAKTAPEQYQTLMRELGATPEQIADDTLRPHWPSVTDWLTRRIAQGLPEPGGIDPQAMRPVYSLLIRENAPIDGASVPTAQVSDDSGSVPF